MNSSPLLGFIAKSDMTANSQFIHIGHRGAAAYATENTLSSIQAALDFGVDMVELDVRRTQDGHFVLSHNPHLHGQHVKRKIKKHTLKQLQDVTLPGGETIATLDQALRFIHTKAMINIDLKETGYETEVYQLIRNLNLDGQTMFSSLNPRSLAAIKEVNPYQFVALSYPSTQLMFLYNVPQLQPFWNWLGRRRHAMYPFHLTIKKALPYRIRRLTLDQGIDALIIRTPFVSAKLVDAVHQKELRLYTWPADRPADIQALRQLGVDGVSTNRPDLINQNKNTL